MSFRRTLLLMKAIIGFILLTIAATAMGQHTPEPRLESGKSVPVAYPSSQPPAVSPDGRFRVINIDSDVEPNHTLFVEDLTTHLRHKLLEYGRQVEVLWNPDSKSVAVTDYTGSNVSECLVFTAGAGMPPEDVWDGILQGVKGEKERATLIENHHVYIAAVRWTSAKTLKVKVWGHGDVNPKGFSRFYVYTLKPR